MDKIPQKYQEIIEVLLKQGISSSSAIHANISQAGHAMALVTIKRTLSEMAKRGLLVASGAGRSTNYNLSALGRLMANLDASQYVAIDPDERYGLQRYNFDLLPSMPTELFTDQELNTLRLATEEFHKRSKQISPAIQKKELERLVIELAWKSSKIEGNTYSLLDTEKLILEHQAAPGHSQDEAQMILNHKDAFDYILQQAAQFKTMTRKNLEELHAILVKNLKVGLGLRQHAVGVTGSVYHPLDNAHQITDAILQLISVVSRLATPYAKALVVLVGISYIQPFEDGNKRTARLMANALLLAHHCAPLSYRSVDVEEYRAAMLVFYEVNSLLPMKQIFIDQYLFAAQQYSIR